MGQRFVWSDITLWLHINQEWLVPEWQDSCVTDTLNVATSTRTSVPPWLRGYS